MLVPSESSSSYKFLFNGVKLEKKAELLKYHLSEGRPSRLIETRNGSPLSGYYHDVVAFNIT